MNFTIYHKVLLGSCLFEEYVEEYQELSQNIVMLIQKIKNKFKRCVVELDNGYKPVTVMHLPSKTQLFAKTEDPCLCVI